MSTSARRRLMRDFKVCATASFRIGGLVSGSNSDILLTAVKNAVIDGF